MRPYETFRKISRAAILQNVSQAQPTDIGRKGRRKEVRKASAVLGIEFGSPVDVDVAGARFGRAVRVARHQDQPLLEQGLDLQTWAALWRVHHRDIEAPLDEPPHELRFETDLRTYRDLGRG